MHVSVFTRYSTEVDVDFVRKSVRAIGRCAIKVEVCCVFIVCCVCECAYMCVCWYH